MSVLKRILATKEEEIRAASSKTPLAELQAIAEQAPPPVGFRDALARATGVALIAEVKKASPSRGIIRDDFDPAAIARAYRKAGASALSVLTDRLYFQGSPENLVVAKEASGLPVLRKDFIIDPYQVWEARAWGADAILLIVAALDDERLAELHAQAKNLGMDVLVEVHEEAETERAVALGADLIGINNRDLSDFHTDLAVTERLARLIGERALIVSESALKSRADIDRVAAAGAKAVLIGTAFCEASDVEAKVREVMGW